MELNSYRGSCHRFIPHCLTLVNGLHEISPVNKLSNSICLSTTHCWLVINLLQRRIQCCKEMWAAACSAADLHAYIKKNNVYFYNILYILYVQTVGVSLQMRLRTFKLRCFFNNDDYCIHCIYGIEIFPGLFIASSY